MIQRDQWDKYWGVKKIFFLIRDTDDATMAGASAESCRFVVLRSLGGRSESIRDMFNRLRRMRGGVRVDNAATQQPRREIGGEPNDRC